MLAREPKIGVSFRCSILVFGVLLIAASPCAGELLRASEWYSRAYRMENGLPSSVIQAITQDHDGFLWVGTRSGVVRFDGFQFVRWNTHGEPKLPSNGALALLTSRDGSVWVGWAAATGGVSRLLHGQVVNYTTRDGLPPGQKSTLLEDRDGTIWAGGTGGLVAFDGTQWQIMGTSHGLELATSVYSLHEDRLGQLWVATAAGIFLRRDRHKLFEHVSPNIVHDLSEDDKGTIWVTDPNSAFGPLESGASARPADGTTQTSSSGVSILHDHRGIMWVGTRSGLLRVSHQNKAGSTTSLVEEEKGVAEEGVAAIYEDRDGDIWVGTRGGLLRIFKHDVTMFTRDQGLTNNVVGPVELDHDGNLWVGTVDALHKISERQLTSYPLPGLRIEALHQDQAARLWLATDEGVGRFENGRLLPLAVADSAVHGLTYALTSDLQGGLWLCGDSTARWDGRNLSTFNDNPEIGSRMCTSAYRGANGNIWLGFADGSLLVHQNGQFIAYSTRHRENREGIAAIRGDRRHRIWVAGQSSLSRIAQGQVTTVTKENGFPGTDIGGFVDDEEGHLWIAFDEGIIRLSKSEFDNVAGDPAHQIQYLPYDSSDGVLDAPTRNGYPSAVRDKGGKLWFQTVRGLAVIDPRRDVNVRSVTTIEIDRIIADGQVLPMSPLPTLPPGTSAIEINYTAASLAAASKVHFSYMLQGFDEDWVDAGARRQAFYNSLSPGTYRFHVRATIGGASRQSAVQEFTVLPAFYRQGWFSALCLAMVCTAVLAIRRWRVRAVRDQFVAVLAERARIGREIHDTMLQSMAGIALEIHAVVKQLGGSPETQELTRIRYKIQQHMRDARDSILELRSAQSQTGDLAEALRTFGDIAKVQSCSQFELTVTGAPRSLPVNVEQELLRTAREAVRNALRHAEARHVDVTVEYKHDSLRLSVSDDGRGFDPATLPLKRTQRWGILGMRERTEKLQGQFKIASSPGQGTVVDIVVPFTTPRGWFARVWRRGSAGGLTQADHSAPRSTV